MKSKCKSKRSKKSKQQNNLVSKENKKKIIKIDMMWVMWPLNTCLHVLCISIYENYKIDLWQNTFKQKTLQIYFFKHSTF